MAKYSYKYVQLFLNIVHERIQYARCYRAWWCSVKKVFLKTRKFTRKHLWQSLIFSEVSGLRLASLLKKGLWHECFPLNFTKFAKANFFKEHLQMAASKYVSDIS